MALFVWIAASGSARAGIAPSEALWRRL